ncbi:hypothetical protein [Shimia ponticola]|uniref:hypothetical protein n=1 Tax=Shimia ponticola TaxID=2582893 RepID=UPI0011BF2CC5|nr:hypothetical protein [Shimia ponticola]
MKYVLYAIFGLVCAMGGWQLYKQFSDPRVVEVDRLQTDESISAVAEAPNAVSATADGTDRIKEAGSSMSIPVTGDVAGEAGASAATGAAITTLSAETAPDMGPRESASGNTVSLRESFEESQESQIRSDG